MFGFTKMMFIVLLSPCTTSRLAESLASTSEGRKKCVVRHEWCGCKWGLNESVCNSDHIWNHDKFRCDCKELDDGSSCINNYIWNLSTCDWGFNKACKIDEYLDIKNCSCKKCLLVKLVLDKVLNTTETLLVDKNVTCENHNCLFYNIPFVIICLLLVIISISCYNYYARRWIKWKCTLLHEVKMKNVKEINVKNRM